MEKVMLKSGGNELVQPLIVADNSPNDSTNTLSRSFNGDKPCCISHYISTQTKLAPNATSIEKLKISPFPIDRATYSSSCENLKVAKTSDQSTFGSARLTKANSDNPVFGSQSVCCVDGMSSCMCVPPVPPRDYLWHATLKMPKVVEIHPVLQDGEKLSNTHYWLLPGKQPSTKEDCSEGSEEKGPMRKKKEEYVNFKEAAASDKSKRALEQLKSRCIVANSMKNRPLMKDLVGKFLCDGRTGIDGDDDEPLLDLQEDNFLEGNYDNMTVQAMLDPDIKFNCDYLQVPRKVSTPKGYSDTSERCTSLEAKDMIEKVQSAVEGMTLEECQIALSLVQWNVDAAIKYLKVESLFRLAIGPRDHCRKVLENNQWDLNKAASALLDLSTAKI